MRKVHLRLGQRHDGRHRGVAGELRPPVADRAEVGPDDGHRLPAGDAEPGVGQHLQRLRVDGRRLVRAAAAVLPDLLQKSREVRRGEHLIAGIHRVVGRCRAGVQHVTLVHLIDFAGLVRLVSEQRRNAFIHHDVGVGDESSLAVGHAILTERHRHLAVDERDQVVDVCIRQHPVDAGVLEAASVGESRRLWIGDDGLVRGRPVEIRRVERLQVRERELQDGKILDRHREGVVLDE